MLQRHPAATGGCDAEALTHSLLCLPGFQAGPRLDIAAAREATAPSVQPRPSRPAQGARHWRALPRLRPSRAAPGLGQAAARGRLLGCNRLMVQGGCRLLALPGPRWPGRPGRSRWGTSRWGCPQGHVGGESDQWEGTALWCNSVTPKFCCQAADSQGANGRSHRGSSQGPGRGKVVWPHTSLPLGRLQGTRNLIDPVEAVDKICYSGHHPCTRLLLPMGPGPGQAMSAAS